ncbi:hypothetical protein APHAL10511_008638 [Amanita phalloides]|nr:hypothetical protein APHAL10511_008638 [Amanita phalloides]
MSSSAAVRRSNAPFLASLPWFTDAIMKNASIHPFESHEELHLFIQQFLKKEKELFDLAHISVIDGRKPFGRYFCALLGFEVTRVSYERDRFRMHFNRAVNMLMKYRLWDVMTFLYSPDSSGPVPKHGRSKFRAPEKTSFHLMGSIKDLIRRAESLMKSKKGKGMAVPVVHAEENMVGMDFSTGLRQLWGKFHALSDKTAFVSICQNLVLAAYQIKCLLEGLDDLLVPEGMYKKDEAQLRVPLFISLSVSPLALLCAIQWHKKDFHRASLIGIWQCVGNQRPKTISSLEQALWKMIFTLAKGEDDDEKDLLVGFLDYAKGELGILSETEDGWFKQDDGMTVQTSIQESLVLLEECPFGWPNTLSAKSPTKPQSVGLGRPVIEERRVEKEKEVHEGPGTEQEEEGEGEEEEEEEEEEEGSGAEPQEDVTMKDLTQKVARVFSHAQQEEGNEDVSMGSLTHARRLRARSTVRISLRPSYMTSEESEEEQTMAPKASTSFSGVVLAQSQVHGKSAGPRHRKSKVFPAQIHEIIDLTKEWDEPEQPSIPETPIQRVNLPEPVSLYESEIGTYHNYEPSLGSHADGEFLRSLAEAAIPRESEQSGFVTLTMSEFETKSDEEIQALLIDKNIVVKGVSYSNIAFDRRGLERLGSWDAPKTIQDLSIEPDEDGLACRVKTGTLRSMFLHAKHPQGRILNGLEFPYPSGCKEPDLQLSSDTVAWVHTMQRPLCKRESEKPMNDIRWGLAATAGAITNWHIDSNGFGTYVDVQTGKKWWVIAREKKRGLAFANRRMYAHFDPQDVNLNLWEVHAVMLSPGDRLYMRPHTPHAVVTLENSICFGGHFYCTRTLKETCIGVLQTFVGSQLLTNSDCRGSWKLFHRMVVYYHHVLVENRDDPDVDKAHVPDVMQQHDLIGLVLFCVVLELSSVLHPGSYDLVDTIGLRERILLVDARKHSRLIISWLRAFWVVTQESASTDVDVFEVLLWQVAMALSSSIEDSKESLKAFLPECTPDAVACTMHDALLQRHKTPNWLNRGRIQAHSYDWEGGALVIKPRFGATMPSEGTENGMTEGDIYAFDGKQPPSFDEAITMATWLQRASGKRERTLSSQDDDDSEEDAGE